MGLKVRPKVLQQDLLFILKFMVQNASPVSQPFCSHLWRMPSRCTSSAKAILNPMLTTASDRTTSKSRVGGRLAIAISTRAKASYYCILKKKEFCCYYSPFFVCVFFGGHSSSFYLCEVLLKPHFSPKKMTILVYSNQPCATCMWEGG